MPFLSASTLLSRPCAQLPPLATLGRRTIHDAFSDVVHPSFSRIGLSLPLEKALHKAFPNVQYPTAIQRKVIPAIYKGHDVLLKDATGTGKCVHTLSLCCIERLIVVQVVWSNAVHAQPTSECRTERPRNQLFDPCSSSRLCVPAAALD